MTKRSWFLALLALAAFSGPAAAWTPDGPVRILVGSAAGGPTDSLARIFVETARARLPQPVVVENLTGAGGNIAAAAAVRARPDGRTFLLGYAALVINNLRGDPPGAVDPTQSLVPVARLATSPAVVMTRASSGIEEFKALLARLRAKGEPASWAPPLPGTAMHVVGEQMVARLGVQAVMIPYRGSAALLPDFLAGRLTFVCDNPTVHLSYLQDGSTRALAVAAAQRSALLPEVPTLAELGLPGIDFTSWLGVLAPVGTDPAAIAAMAEIAQASVSGAEARARLAAIGLEPAPTGSEEFRGLIAGDLARWKPAVAAVQGQMQQ
ncbi:tripartite tricarboxylate transporter substrate binding protein [Belnapia sp. T6]|uniref:Tripartite tricarboxylate transporter substrate binding protein n=1 Tax=Belnapia mucosa TaxID=2804532 RepID=A0ABS1V6Q3_9PROT|nr:tripartite tricarboxylate transporter substrate binding protein [Belnapia mucosa]MBL6457361.1 tripartite tricarboxylate transporter substrate binding protein [Belnapia mucosa]